jgi:Flp pilus assembly protein TadD
MKKALLVFGIVVALGGVAVVVRQLGLPAYRHFRENRALVQARQFAANKQYQEASLSLRQTLQFNPRNLEAVQMMADMAALARAPQELDWRKRIAELAPTPENKLNLAFSALRLQGPPFPLATQTLEELADSSQNLPAFQSASAELAARLNNREEAISRMQQACRLDPTNEQYRLNLAILNLSSSNEVAKAEGRRTLQNLQQSTNSAPVVLRALMADAVLRREMADATRFSRTLIAHPEAQWEDRLQHLAILKESDNPEFGPSLAALQNVARTNALTAAATASWMVYRGQAAEAQQWLSNCAPAIRAQQPVPAVYADCFAARKDWLGLEVFLEDQKWDELEFLRLAMLSEAAHQQKHDFAATTRWRSALREAGDRLGCLMRLLALAERWNRNTAKEELLWQIIQKMPRERWATTELERLYTRTGNTLGLNKLYTAMAGLGPANFALKNNVASTSLLLKMNLPKAHDLAREAYTEHPENPAVAATFGFSLQLQGKTPEALAIFHKLPSEALETPEVALYYGLALAAAGDTNSAAKYLSRSATAPLLPEEKQLLADASAALK